MKNYHVDCAIIGGGVAGLWTLNALAVAGYSVVLIEKNALGSGQTIQSQGIIHGGVKYAGSNDVRADFIAEVRRMPDRWREHLSGKQKPDLGNCKVLTDKQYLWVSGSHGWFSRIEGLFSTTALQLLLHTKPEEVSNPPQCLSGAIKVYTVAEPSIDTTSLLEELARPHQTAICYAGSTLTITPNGQLNFVNQVAKINQVTLDAKLIILTAGNANKELMRTAGIAQEVQVLPLRQVLVKGALPVIYGHCLDGGRPDISISTHYTSEGETVWNIGGKVAEEGHLISHYDLIEKTRKRFARALPSVSLEGMQWSTFDARRVEPVGHKGKRLGRASVMVKGKFIAGLPTKLACAPILADMIRMEVLKQISPSFEEPPVLTPAGNIRIATPPWNEGERSWY